jgi:cold shock CspA family protein
MLDNGSGFIQRDGKGVFTHAQRLNKLRKALANGGSSRHYANV